ncbi:hypothetical protein EJ04DRAFT_138017 [Polyplosphaeria fusca]|uniref:RING-type domain-containing protein n=1 Tax=Polyplosphaeria fusca TaxID=682080 RepID=A0A9P4UW31_9PLEO|nr:hypothetical protein EJ04DRAFT_138017 [Polyplosphaeria fusca]
MATAPRLVFPFDLVFNPFYPWPINRHNSPSSRMARTIPDPAVYDFLQRHTVPRNLSSLCPDQDECSLCLEKYAAQVPGYTHPQHPSSAPEYPVQICNVGACRHIFGRLCMQSHIESLIEKGSSCPFCREEWLSAQAQPAASVSDDVRERIELERMVRGAGGDVEPVDAADILTAYMDGLGET